MRFSWWNLSVRTENPWDVTKRLQKREAHVMRPILMTTLTTIISMVPMALGIGEGLELMAPMAVSVMGGLIASTLLTLFIIPVLYAIVDDMETKSGKRRLARRKIRLYREALWLAKSNAKKKTKNADKKKQKS